MNNSDLQEFLMMSNGQEHNVTIEQDSFQKMWNDLGNYVRNFQAPSAVQTCSFGVMSFRDFLVFVPQARPDRRMFWALPEWTNVRITSSESLSIDKFYELEQELVDEQIQWVLVFEASECTILKSPLGIQLITIPCVLGPGIIYFFLQCIMSSQGPQQIVHEANTTVENTGSLSIQDMIQKYISVHQTKPTIQKISTFFGISLNDLKKEITKSGKSWSELTKCK